MARLEDETPDPARRPALPAWLHLWTPLILLALYPAARAIDFTFYKEVIYAEGGVVENLTAIAGFLAAIAAVAVAFQRGALPARWFGPLFLALGLACLFLSGEELSWGQRIFGWETPEEIAAINKQKETNLHNMTELLDRYLRLIGGVGAFVGGMILPLVERRTGWLPFGDRAWARYLCPTRDMVTIGAVVALPRVIERYQTWFKTTLPPPFDLRTHEYQEFQELGIALFLLFYAASVLLRLRAAARTAPA